MSTKYKKYNDVPTDVLANRLEQLSDSVDKGYDEMRREFTRRIPAELDRDADLVLSQSARRMTELTAELAKVTAERDAICSMIIDLDDMCVDSEEYGELGLELLAKAQDKLGLVDRVRMQELRKQAEEL